jgi:3D (Asp-Asp-Asp) domain-containing protein
MTIRLAKARTVTVRLDGVEQNLYTQAQTVADILTLLGVQPGPGDIIEPATDSYVVSGMTLIIALTRVVEEEASEAVAAGVVNETDLSLAEGSVRIIPGTDGLRLNRYRVTYKNGVEVAREPLPGGGITVPPVPTRHITGAKTGHPRAVLNTPEFTRPYSRSLTVRATWYNALGGGKFPGDPAYGLTRTGVMLDYGICAVDPAVIPLGTRFHVPGYGDCLAADTGGAIQGNIIDLGYPDSAGDPGWGVQTVTIYILD